ncbi:MAG: hypothetical protein ABI723_09225 [Bacteroidia bacterium]
MKQRILTGWNFQRALFLLMGIYLMVQSVMEKQWMSVAVGAYFAAMGLFAFGCAAGGCFGRNCNYEPIEKNKSEIQDIEFEEIKQK